MKQSEITMRDYFEKLIAERDRQYLQRFEAQQQAVTAALDSAQRAVQKAETASDARFASVNEFRAALSDASAKQITRVEVDEKIIALNEKLSALKESIEVIRGIVVSKVSEEKGMAAGWGYLVSGVGFLITIGLAAIAFSAFNKPDPAQIYTTPPTSITPAK